ncbi:MAG TPA: GntR family transcriptional regulator [Caldithrix abyssi]|uniref:GntR family transcriptional regulator n=1 Tax=Caldithrix abyssi TaxID=187145 RepID=A0A7V4WTX7_CALAY|nr:GntR family transcriptional regulator [Caldithrix abyssi]
MVQIKEETKSLSELAYERIEERIVTLQLAPGSFFSEAELSAQLGIGRTPVREALQRLVADGLVKTMPRRGMMVSEINIADQMDLLETRRALERIIVTRAARRATPPQQATLQEYANAIQDAAEREDLEEFMRFDHKFDRLVESASGNSFAVKANAPFHAHCRRFWYYYHLNGDLRRSADLHAAIMRAIADKDETAAARASDAFMDYLEEFTRDVLNR